MNPVHRILAVVVPLVVLLTGCAPQPPVEVGSKEMPVDIILGREGLRTPPPPLTIDPGTIGSPGFIQPPLPRFDPGTQPPPPPPPPRCPIADPTDAALLVARLEADPPVEATYPYRNQGSFRVGETAETAYPETTERTVANVREIDRDGNYEFDVITRLAGATTTTTYRVIDEGPSLDRGVFVVQIVTRGRRTESFTPDTPILLLPFPGPDHGTGLEDELNQYRGERYRSVGTDPLTQTTMVLEARMTGKMRVDACGEWVDGYEAEITFGRIVGPTKDLEFTGRYVVATQFGGLVVEDEIEMRGVDAGDAMSSRNRSRISRVPVARDQRVM